YMSPEQAEGHKLDARSDIFSFGSVLYEMITGRPAFTGESQISTLSAILQQEPKPLEGVPADLDKIIRRCLRKDAARRFQHMDDLKVALEELREEFESGALKPAVKEKSEGRFPKGIWAPVLALIAAGALWWPRPAPEHVEPFRKTPLTSYPGSELQPT